MATTYAGGAFAALSSGSARTRTLSGEPPLAELRRLADAVLNDRLIEPLSGAQQLCPYTFPVVARADGSMRPETRQRIFSMGFFHARLVSLVEATGIWNDNAKGLLLDANSCVTIMQQTNDPEIAKRCFIRLRDDMQSIVQLLPLPLPMQNVRNPAGPAA